MTFCCTRESRVESSTNLSCRKESETSSSESRKNYCLQEHMKPLTEETGKLHRK